MSWPEREAEIWWPPSSTTRDTLNALFSSKEAVEMSLSRATNRTFTLAVRVCVRGLISASMA